jgi:hypothetical protein
VLLACVVLVASAPARAAALKTIAVLDFELVDDQHALSPATVEYARLAAISNQLRRDLAMDGLYRVVDNAPQSTLIAHYRATQPLYDCNGCELDIGRALHADRVLVGWVQKVSNLILNINVAIKDVATGEVVLSRSVDLRGNTDTSWMRGIDYLVRSIVDAHDASR